MRLLILLSIALIATSCSSSRMYLTVATKKQIENAGVDIAQVQFYNSHEIVLARALKKEELKVAEGKVRIENGQEIEEIIIPANTPGICELHDEKTLKVSFDDGTGKGVPFLVERKGDMVVETSYFRIGAKEWAKTERGLTIGKIDYDGKLYNLVRGTDSRLMISKSVLTKVERDTHVAKGRKL